MSVNRVRRHPLASLALVALAAAVGCFGTDREHHHHWARDGERSVDELQRSSGWYDLEAQAAIHETVPPKDLIEWAEKARALRKPAVPSPRKSILIVSGGGIYGDHPAGALPGGWAPGRGAARGACGGGCRPWGPPTTANFGDTTRLSGTRTSTAAVDSRF